jgi:hypothetical protein
MDMLRSAITQKTIATQNNMPGRLPVKIPSPTPVKRFIISHLNVANVNR